MFPSPRPERLNICPTIIAFVLSLFTGVCAAAGAAGCGSLPPLPSTVTVPISHYDTVDADIGTGPLPLANSGWVLTRAEDDDYPLGTGYLVQRGLIRAGTASRVRRDSGRIKATDAASADALRAYFPRPDVGETIFVVHFGPAGEMIEVTENEYLLPRLYGTEVPIGGRWVTTPLPGVAFRSESYGLSVGNHYAVAARFQVRLFNCPLAAALVYSYGQIDGDTSDGEFGYSIDFTDGVLPFLGKVEDEYAAIGTRLK